MSLLTVVLPAYNVQDYIARCIDSVLRQPAWAATITLVIVVDGATDNTLTIAKSVTQHLSSSVKIIEQNNQGLSAARNAGVELATTEYITFLDGDDVWLPTYLDTVLPAIENRWPDIVEYDALRISTTDAVLDTVKISAAPNGAMANGSRDAFLAKFLCFAWARVYRTSLVRDHLYPVGRRFEDTATTPWYYWKSTNITSLGTPLIGYRQRLDSILATPRRTDIDDIACTTAEAAAMYRQTGSSYWQRVTHRSLQQACSRITLQPVHTWPPSLRASYAAAAAVPPPSGITRWLQASFPLTYVALLRGKRTLENGGLSKLLFK